MNYENYCGLYEHQTAIKICLLDKCKERSRFICKLCNTEKSHTHNQTNYDHIIDYEYIIKIQERLKEQSYQYHFHSHKIKQIQNVLEECKQQIQKLEAQLQKYGKYYDRYYENLFAFQYYFSQQIDPENNQIAKMINQVYNFDKDKFLKSFHKIINNIMQKNNESTQYILDLSVNDDQDKMLKLVNHKLKEIDYAQISQNGKYLYYYGSQYLLTYDIIEQGNESILLNYHDIISFQISKTQKQFYIGDIEGKLRLYDKNQRKAVQFHLQKQEIVDIKVISKHLVILRYDNLPEDNQQVQVVNLKINKIIYIIKIPNTIQQIIYSDVNNYLIVVQPSCVDVITLDSKLKRKEQIKQNDNRTVYYNQNCQQLIILDYDWHLTFYDLNQAQFKKRHISNQINQYKNVIINFTFNENFQLLIILTFEGIIIQNIQGKIIKTLNCSYSQKVDLSNQGELIILRTTRSISLLKLDFK